LAQDLLWRFRELLEGGDELVEGLVEIRRLTRSLGGIGVADDLVARHRVPGTLGLERVLHRLHALGCFEHLLGPLLAYLIRLLQGLVEEAVALLQDRLEGTAGQPTVALVCEAER